MLKRSKKKDRDAPTSGPFRRTLARPSVHERTGTHSAAPCKSFPTIPDEKQPVCGSEGLCLSGPGRQRQRKTNPIGWLSFGLRNGHGFGRSLFFLIEITGKNSCLWAIYSWSYSVGAPANRPSQGGFAHPRPAKDRPSLRGTGRGSR